MWPEAIGTKWKENWELWKALLLTVSLFMLENCKRIQNLILGDLMRLVSQANAMCGWVCVFSQWRSGTSVLPCHPLLTHLPEVAGWSDADEVESDGLTLLKPFIVSNLTGLTWLLVTWPWPPAHRKSLFPACSRVGRAGSRWWRLVVSEKWLKPSDQAFRPHSLLMALA